MTNYSYEFHSNSSYKEWFKLPADIRKLFVEQLEKVCEKPELAKPLRGALSGYNKIVLKKNGYRLVYELRKDKLVILIVHAGKRSNSDVYKKSKDRIS